MHQESRNEHLLKTFSKCRKLRVEKNRNVEYHVFFVLCAFLFIAIVKSAQSIIFNLSQCRVLIRLGCLLEKDTFDRPAESSPAPVSSVWWPLDRCSLGTGDVAGLVSLLSDHNVKLYHLKNKRNVNIKKILSQNQIPCTIRKRFQIRIGKPTYKFQRDILHWYKRAKEQISNKLLIKQFVKTVHCFAKAKYP